MLRILARDGMRAAAAEIALLLDGTPRLAATAPAADENVPPSTTVTAWTLGELGELGAEALTLQRQDAPEGEPTVVPGRLQRLPAGDGVRFVPDAPLAAEASYRAVFGAGVTAADGTPFGEPLAWTFETVAAIPEPSVVERDLSVDDGTARGDPSSPPPETVEAREEPPPVAPLERRDDARDEEARGVSLPEVCAGVPREQWEQLVTGSAQRLDVTEEAGACHLVYEVDGSFANLLSFAFASPFFYPLERPQSQDGVTRFELEADAYQGSAVLEEGPPHRATWTVSPR